MDANRRTVEISSIDIAGIEERGVALIVITGYKKSREEGWR